MTAEAKRSFIVGRGPDCDVRVDDEYLSKHHCRVWVDDDDRIWIEDLGSTNGTRIIRNGLTFKVWPKLEIKPGDSIMLSSKTVIPWESVRS